MKNDEFFPGASEWPQDLSRRGFLEMAAASLALAGFTGCTRLPVEKIIPYVKNPDDVIPGKPIFYSTAYVQGGLTTGILVESHMGRPTKIEGNPLHPASFGAATAQQQAFILSLYDQDRSSKILWKGKKSSWEQCKEAILGSVSTAQKNKGRGLYFLTEFLSSPTLEDQFSQILKKYPEARWIQYEPISSHKVLNASNKVFGTPLQPLYHLDQAEAVVCFDADLFSSPLFPLSYTQDFIKKRRASEKTDYLPPLFVIEPTPSLTGAWTPHRLSLKSTAILALARELLLRLDGKKSDEKFSSEEETFLKKIVLRQTQGSCLFIAGEHADEYVHEICHHLNSKYAGPAVSYLDAPASAKDRTLRGIKALSEDLHAGRVESLFIFGGNPAYNTPATLKFAQALNQAKNCFRFALIEDETSDVSSWHIPLAHPLETWSDARSFDGTISLIQPLIAPLFDGKSPHEILSLFLAGEASSYDIVQSYWRKTLTTKFDDLWVNSLSQGLFSSDKPVPIKNPKSRFVLSPSATKGLPSKDTIEVLFRPDDTLWDGRFGNNPWLQELPKYLSKLTWENAALVSPAFAKKNKIKTGQYLLIETQQGKLKAPAWILPGQDDDSIKITFGYGRKRGGKIIKGLGYNAYQIWAFENPDVATGQIKVLDEHTKLASTQTHHTLEENEIVQRVSLKEAAKRKSPAFSLYPKNPLPMAREAWAMVIDLDSCIGCSACMVACQSENNIPVVGKEGVLRGREMHWIRVDTYYSENSSQPQVSFQPVACMHCEKAPCELVCPVGATVHSTDGLNQMVYNRCIGTRYCSNNCPYKVRRFNFFALNSEVSDLSRMQKNPDVSVRSRGVMEKCTYCVQRIEATRIEARKENRDIRDGEIKTACQATCPTRAITFGNKNDLSSQVHQLRQSPRSYILLEELGTLPRTTYLAKINDGGSDA